MAFEGLSEKLNNVFKKLKSHGKLTESDVKTAMREVKLALLEADVSYKVVKDFVAKVSCVSYFVEVCGYVFLGFKGWEWKWCIIKTRFGYMFHCRSMRFLGHIF